MQRTDYTNWDEKLVQHPSPSLLQTAAWAEVKEQYGWSSIPVEWKDANGKIEAMASVLKRQISLRGIKLPVSMLYIPKGPIVDWSNERLVQQVLTDLVELAKQEKAFLIKIEPEIPQFEITNAKEPETVQLNPVVSPQYMQSAGWVFSDNQIQFRNSVFIDLKGSEDKLLADMKQKTRYNIRLAERKDILIRQGTKDDFETIYQLYAETSIRDGFIIRSKDYYLTVWNTFFDQKQLTPLIATYQDEPLAALMLFHFGKTAYYVYGMSTNKHRNRMPTYLLQWEAIKTAKELGCETYDLWGAPGNLTEEDPMWGVYRFKLGLGGKTIGTIGAWDHIVQPFVFTIYSKVMPKILNILRKRGKVATAEDVDSLA